MSTYQLLQHAAQIWPNQSAIIDVDITLSYKQLYEQAELLKIKLIEEGITQGIGLGIMGQNSSAFIIAMFAGMACGATVLPLSHQLKQAELEHIVLDTQLHIILDDQAGVVPVCDKPVLIDCLNQSLRLSWTGVARDKAMTHLVDAAFIRYTSGTTGTSKGVVLSHQSIQARVEAAQATLGLTSDDTVLWVLPMAFHFLVTILVYIRSGAKIILCKNLLAKTIINDANKYKATTIYASPMHFRLLAADASGKSMTSIISAISTSSGISINIADAFKQRFNIPVTQAYGIIEAGLPLIDSLSEQPDPNTVGYPASGFFISIFDKDNQQVGSGQIGRLAIRGKGMFDAYLKPWQMAEEIMQNGWFMTGDLAQRNKDGRIIICGREKTMINVAGNKAFPEEIESILDAHMDILESHVFGESHPLMGEIVCAEVIVKKNVSLNVEGVLTFCRKQLSTYKVPQRLYQVNQIMHTSSGKIKRVE